MKKNYLKKPLIKKILKNYKIIKLYIMLNNFSYKKSNSKLLDLMIINHFIIYFILGYFIPHNYLLCIIISILWEVFEYFITYWDVSYNLLIKYWPISERHWNEKLEHKIMDILVNLLGYYFGSNYRYYFIK
jgi:hypothetical protein